jgi:multicomponent Na+:H+ antiporter subunit E
MNLFLLNVLLGLGFMIAQESFTLSNLCAGFGIGYAVLWLMRPLYKNNRYFTRVNSIIRLTAFFTKALFLSNFRVLWDVVTPSQISRPGIIRMELEARTDLEIMLVANLISLTPGTLSVDTSKDNRYLYVHVMFLEDLEQTRRELKNGLERRVLEVLR